jgi:uncharacterized membrane protein YraQ (UPF0718 family)
MQEFLSTVQDVLTKMVMEVIGTLMHNWLPLLLAIVAAALMKTYINQEKLKQVLLKRTKISIWGAVALGALTPLCACGTMAVVLGLLTTTLPWGPIMAFLTSSPLMSPDGFIMTAGILGYKFAIALLIASLVIGLGSGYVTHFIEKKTNFLKNQTRFSKEPRAPSCGCPEPVLVTPAACGCPPPVLAVLEALEECACPAPVLVVQQACGCSGPAPGVKQTCCNNLQTTTAKNRTFLQKIKMAEFGKALLNTGLKQILLFYSIFVGIGFLINYFIPSSVIAALLSANNATSVPLAGLIGLPLYVTGEGSIPLINALMAGGAGAGAMLAFIITGSGTSAWVIAGISVFMKRRIITLYVLFLLVGGILSGYLYDLFLAIGI